MQRQRSTFFKATHVQKSCVQVSYKQCAIKMVKSFGDDKLAKNFETVSLSHQTVSRRTAKRSKQLDAQLSKEIEQSKYFSVALDESTDITNFCQLLIFVKTVYEQFSIKELLDLVPLPTSVKGSDIYSVLVCVVDNYCGFSKCSFIVTDSAKCTTGKNTGLVGLLRQCDVNVPVLHCIIHQEVLCRKFVKMNNVMKDVTRISSNQRKLLEFLKELSAEFLDIPLHSEIRWLIAVLRNCWKKIEYDYLEKLQNEEWLCTLAFLTDITEHPNIFNLKLQAYLKSDLRFFKSCREIKNEFNSADFKQHRQYVIELRGEFKKQFSDFDNMKTIFQLFADPMVVTIEDQDPKLQMELWELQSHILFSSK
ncbi:hypothetical protein PR048_001968 [Dryococelus australis]|uniref:Transposase n=1 Tax=Dryococelus australis TaxID=614101 RepID=A0ABQ9IJ05_9NEOP|nr:hypothetical protein PR048_001968 [Dryococelus australis]